MGLWVADISVTRTYLYICLSMLHETQNEMRTTGGVRAQFESGQQFGPVHHNVIWSKSLTV